MRRTILSILLLSVGLAARPAAAGVNFWSPIGPDGGTITALAAAPSNSKIVYAGTTGGVFKSTDAGAHWTRASRGLTSTNIAALAVAPSDPSTLYASTGFGVFVSRNGGAAWSQIFGRGYHLYIPSLAVDPRNPRWVWMGTAAGPFWTHDGGTHWHEVDARLLGWIWSLAIDPVHPDTVYVASVADQDYGETTIAKTTDGGKTWKRRNGGLDHASIELGINDVPTQLTVDPTAPDTVYGCFAQDSGDPDVTQIVTYRSTDGAATWKATEGGFPLAVDRHGTVYAGDRRSTDHGASWQRIATPPDFPQHYLAGDGVLWAGLDLSGVSRSLDSGATWQPSSSGLNATSVSAIAVDPEQPRTLYAAASGIGLFKTLNAGASWQRADAGLPAEAFYPRLGSPVLALDPHQPETLYSGWVTYSATGFARSDDGAEHWSLLPNDPFGPSDLRVEPGMPGALYLTGTGNSNQSCGVARSDDHGLTRRCVLSSSGKLIFDHSSPGTLWLLTATDLRKSTDRGETWTTIQPQGLEHSGLRRSLLVDPVHSNVLYLGTEQDDREQPSRIWRSDDGGLHWLAWGSGLPENSVVNDLLIDPQQPSIFYAAVEQHFYPPFDRTGDRSGVFISRDGGQTYTALRDGLPGVVQQLILDPTNPRVVYATTPNDGIYTFTRGR